MHALKSIALIGLRGSGKTTLGKTLANKLKYDFFDLDVVFQEKLGQSIANFVSAHGWEAFRKEEARILSIMPKTNAVLACGGGVVLLQENREILAQDCFTVFIDVPLPELVKRLEANLLKEQRPAFTNKTLAEEMQELYNARYLLYNDTAQYKVQNNSDMALQIEEILKAYKHFRENNRGNNV